MKLGERQTLTVVKTVDFGVYLAESDTSSDKVLLPKKGVPEGTKVGDCLDVFVYRDSSDRIISTCKSPKLLAGEVKELVVSDKNKFGAFLDWGLEKDLFLPFKEQRGHFEIGDSVLVSLYIDKSSRLCATMNVYKNLKNKSPYKTGDKVRGRIYETSDNFGAFVAVDNIYSALIPKKELFGEYEPGQDIEATVTRVLDDGRLNLSIRERGLTQILKDADKLRDVLDSFAGVLPFNDKSPAEVITYETGMSKNEFKRAVGNLLKAGEIEITEKGIRRIK